MIQNILNQLNRIEKLFTLSMNVYQLLMTLKIYDIYLTRSITLYTGSSNTFKVSSNECFFPPREKALCMSHLNPEMITRIHKKMIKEEERYFTMDVWAKLLVLVGDGKTTSIGVWTLHGRTWISFEDTGVVVLR